MISIIISGQSLRSLACAVLPPLAITLASCDRPELPLSPVPANANSIGFSASGAFGPEWGPWSTPVNLSSVNSPTVDNQPTLSPDQLSLYFASARAGGAGGNDLWVAQRAATDSPWQAPVNLAALNTSGNDQGPSLSSDGLLLFFHSDRPGGYGEQDIYISRRTDGDDDFSWQAPVNLGAHVNTSVFEAGPLYLQQIEEGRTNFYFGRGPTTVDIDVYATELKRNGEVMAAAVPVPELNFAGSGITDGRATARRDGKELIFFSTRPGGFGLADLYVTTRQSVHFPWATPVNLGSNVNSAFTDTQPSLSLDGAILLFTSNRPGGVGGNDIWMSTRTRWR